MPTERDVDALRSALSDVATLTIAGLAELFRSYGDNPEFTAIIAAAFPELIGQHGQAAALITAQWYDELAPELDFHATPEVDLPDDRLTGSLEWALNAPGKASPLERLGGAAQRMIFDASRQTTLANLADEYDTDDVDEGTLWARHASANACSFCRLLATRGAVYRSAASASSIVGRSVNLELSDRRAIAAGQMSRSEALAQRSVYRSARQANKRGKSVGGQRFGGLRGKGSHGGKYHDHCHCIAVPVRPGTSYDPPDYVSQWHDDYIAASRESDGDELKDILRHMDQQSRRRARGESIKPIKMVDIEIHGRDGNLKTMSVPADSPAARAYARRNS